jgi:hypothetical protein
MATYDDILTNISNVLPELSSTSQLAVYRKIAQAIAISIDNTTTEINGTKDAIDEIITTQRYGRSGYYIEKAKAFQLGDTLAIDPITLDPIYTTINESKKIVKQAAFEIVEGLIGDTLTLKVAKLDTNTNKLAPLDEVTEMPYFESYFQNFEIPGLPIQKVTRPANEFDFSPVITYYATSDLQTLITEVNAAFIEFRNNFEFDGVLYTNDVEAFVKKSVAGVRNVSLNNPTIGGVAYVGNIKLDAGYFDYSTNALTQLLDTVNYVSI